MYKEAITHIKEEYSTFDWVMEQMLEKAGFAIENTRYHDGVIGIYLCSKSI